MANTEAIEKGKRYVEEQVRERAAKQDIDTTDFKWDPVSSTGWQLKVTASNGRLAYQDFSIKHLEKHQTDKKVAWQIIAKEASSIILQLEGTKND